MRWTKVAGYSAVAPNVLKQANCNLQNKTKQNKMKQNKRKICNLLGVA